MATQIDICEPLNADLQAMAAIVPNPGVATFIAILGSDRESAMATTEHLYLAQPRSAAHGTDLFACQNSWK